jgi:DNA-binding response OmpR family regulator
MKRILIIDDDEDFLEWITTGLTKEGYAISTATTAASGLSLLREQVPDVAIIDIYLPDIDGFEACRRVKNDQATASVPVILVTGVFKEVEALEKGYQSGADDFLIKPFSYEQLRLRVIRQLQG